MKTILFVCTGNTCRSTMAEALFKKMLKDQGKEPNKLEIKSAGTCAWDGHDASPNTIEALRRKGIELEGFKSRLLTVDLIDQADLILTMTNNHKATTLYMRHDAENKVFTLKEYVNNGDCEKTNDYLNVLKYDIRDPFGQSVEVYGQSLDEIEENLQKIYSKIFS